MRTTLIRSFAIPIGAVALVAAGAFLLHPWWRKAQRVSPESSSAPRVAAPLDRNKSPSPAPPQPDMPPETTAELIHFPRALWEPAELAIQTATVGPLDESIELTGKVALNEDRLAHIFPLVEGRVDEVRVQFGQHVNKDDVLVVVQSREVGQIMLELFQDRRKLELAESKDRWTQEVGRNAQSMIALMRAGASLEQIEETLTDRPLGDYRQTLMTAYIAHRKAQSHLERLSPLSSTGAVPARQVLEAQAEADAARATLQSLWEQISQEVVQAARISAQAIQEVKTRIAMAETNLRILGFDDDDLRGIDPAVQGEGLAHYPVVAPFDGTVISKDVVLLERVSPERQILTIADLSTVWITVDVYERHLPLLSRVSEQSLRVRCDAWPGREFEARIFSTGDVVQESTRTIALRAEAANPEGLLKPGMFVTVVLPSLAAEAVVQVPWSAVQDHAGSTFVFVQTGAEEFSRREVVLGRRNREFVEVRSGIQANDRVVVRGGFALKSRLLAALLAE